MSKRDVLIGDLLFILLLFMSVFSTVLMPFKIALTVAITILVVLKKMTRGGVITENRGILNWMILYIISNVVAIIVAVTLGSENAFIGLNTNIIEPILFFIIIGYLSFEDYKFLYKSLKIILLLISCYDTLYFLYINGLLPFGSAGLFVGMYPNYGGLSIGFVKIHSNNIPWLIFLFPFEASEIFLSSREKSIIDFVTLVLSLLIAFMTLRSSYILAIGLTPFLILFYARISKIDYDKKRATVITVVGAIIIFFLIATSQGVATLIGGTVEKVLLSLSTTQNGIDNGGYVRIAQMRDLIDTWKERPILGWGASANAKHIIRSEIAGAYEMQYFALLMQKGIIGFGIYFGQIIWMISKCVSSIKRKLRTNQALFSILVGFTSIIIANATNPYLGSFDRLLMFFAPLMAYKASLLREERLDG